jgi:capsular exopolysaccharide synthesis family protein
MVNLIVSAVVGVVLGLALAFFIEYLDTSVKTMDDVERFLGMPVLAVIPQGVAPLNHEGGESLHAEPYRILRAKIDLTPSDGQGRSISVVSGGPGEGKSTTLFNLAYVCAQSGQSVLIVDADLRRPTVHRILGIENFHGLADVLMDRGGPAEMILATDIANLHVLTAGDMPMDMMGNFNANRVHEILSDLKQRYDVVLVDSPPILGISDGSVIAHEVDVTLLVIQHRRYPRDIAARAKRAIDEIRGNLVGVVLNAVAIKSDEAYYYYSSYGDYYSKGGKNKKRTEPSAAARKQASIRMDHNGNGSESF